MIDDEVGVDVADDDLADAAAFEGEVVDQFSGTAEFGVLEGAAGAGTHGLGGAAFLVGGCKLRVDFLAWSGGAFEHGGDDVTLFKLGHAAVVVGDLGERLFLDAAVGVDEADADDLVEGFAAHRACIHADGAAEIAGDALHPFKTANACIARGAGDFFEPCSRACGNEVAAGGHVFKVALGVDHRATDAAVFDEEIGATTDDADGDGSRAQVAHHFGKGGFIARLDPVLRGAADEPGGVAVHGLVEARDTTAVGFEDGAEFFQHGQVARDAAADFVHIARTEGDEEIAGAEGIAHFVSCDGHGGRAAGLGVVVLQLHFFENRLAADAGQWFLAGRIDVGDKELVHVAKTGAELLFQKLRAAVAVRLEEADDAFGVEPLGCGQCGGDFAGVVAVVVHHGEALAAVADFKAALGPTEAAQRVLDGLERDTATRGQGDGCERVGDIVLARNAEGGRAEELVFLIDLKLGVVRLHREDVGGEIVLAAPAVADALRAGADLTGHGVFGAMHPEATCLAEDLAEDGLDGFDAVVEVEVLGLDVEHDGVLRVEIDEGAVALIAFGHKELAFGVPVRIGAEDGDLCADVVAGFQAALAQHVGGEGGGGGLAMGAADDDALLVGHHGGQRLRTADERDALLVGGLVGHVAGLDGAGVDDHVAVLHLLFRVAVEELKAELLQALCFQGGGLVRAADLVPQTQQQQRQPAHARARNADEVDAHGVTAFFEEAEDGVGHDG